MSLGSYLARALVAGSVLVVAMPPRRVPSRVGALIDGGGHRHRPGRRSATPRMGVVHAADVLASRVGRWARRATGRASAPALDRRLGRAVLAGSVVAALHPLVGAAVAVALWAGPTAVDRSRRRRRRERFLDAVPDLIELFRLAIGSGLTVHQAVDAVHERVGGDVGDLLAGVRAEVAMGHRLADALERAGGLDDALRPLVSALAGAERYGAPISPTLDRLADGARVERRHRAEEVARRLPVQLLFPLILCILPAFALLTVVPLMLATLDGLPG